MVHNPVLTYEVMHMEKVVATISTRGRAEILNEQFMPFDLYLDEENDIDTLLNNLYVFYHWCASRVLSLDRKYSKEIMNSLGFAQATTDGERAKIALSYHCVSLADVYWVRTQGESVTFDDINLYDHPLNEAIVELSLKGKQMTVTNQELAPDLSTHGVFPKAWIRTQDGFYLLKDGGEEVVRRELLASAICQCFDVPQVVYQEHFYDGQVVTRSKIVSSKEFSLVSKFAYDIYAVNHDLDTIEECIRLDPVTYYGMNIVDYLIGNIDRHQENWGFLVDNSKNEPVSLYPIMDFNQSFKMYDTIDGGKCLTVHGLETTQREAAIEAVKQIGLRQLCEVDLRLFDDISEYAEMFKNRLSVLREYCKGEG